MIILPLFVVFSSVGSALGVQIIGTRPALIVTYLTFAIPFATWLLVTNLRQIPISFEEAAMIDGLSRFGALRTDHLPAGAARNDRHPGVLPPGGLERRPLRQLLTKPDTQTAAIQLQVFAATTEGGRCPSTAS